MPKREYTDADFESEELETTAAARRREFPDMIRDIVSTGSEFVYIKMDANSALNLADDVEFAVWNKTT